MLSYNVELDGKTVLVTVLPVLLVATLSCAFSMISEISGVIGVDSITDYYDVNIKYERLKEIESLDRDWTFVRASIADKER